MRQYVERHAFKLLLFGFCIIILAFFGFASYQAFAAYSCTTARHQDLTRSSGAGLWTIVSADLGNCGDPNGATPTTGAFDTISYTNLPPGQYQVRVQGEYDSNPDEHLLVTTSDGDSKTILDLNGTNATKVLLWGETTVDMCQSSGWIKIASYSTAGPQDFTVKQVQVTLVTSACGIRVSNGGNITITPGVSGNTNSTVTRLSPSIGQATWATSGALPNGVGITFGTPVNNPTFTSSVSVSTPASIPPGTYPITLRADAPFNNGICSTGAPYAKKITIAGAKVPSTQANFPVLVQISNDTNLKSAPTGHVQFSNGSDIHFVDSTGSVQLSHEIESYNSVNGSLTAWVKIPSLTGVSNTAIYLCYGGSAMPYTPTNVWSPDYIGVWHLGEAVTNGGKLKDSTSNKHDGTLVDPGKNASSNVAGKIGSAIHLDSDAFISLGKNALGNPGNNMTVQAWINRDIDSDRAVLSEWHWSAPCANGASEGDFMFGMKNQHISIETPHETRMSGIKVLAIGGWEYADYVSASDARLYVTGTLDATSNDRNWADDCKEDVRIGANTAADGTPGNAFVGTLDEIRIAKVSRSADWLKTEYNNQSSPSTFYVLGAETKGVSTTITRTTTFDLVIIAVPKSDQNPTAINFPPSPNSGDSITFDGEITNQGTLASVPSSARFRMDLNNDGTFDSIISTHPVGIITPLNKVTIPSSTWLAVVGTHRVEFCADINGVDPELNEGNNCRSQTFTVNLAPQSDQNPSALNTPSSPTEGDSMKFDADITNQGAFSSAPSTARFRMDLNNDGTFDSTISTHAVGAITPSTIVTITSGTWTAVAGTHRVEFCADINDVDPETNEANNCRSQTFTVALGAPLSSNVIASPLQVLRGQTSTITWTSTNAVTCTISGPGILFAGTCAAVPKACNGQQKTPPISVPAKYTFQCDGFGSQTNSKEQAVQPILPSFKEI